MCTGKKYNLFLRGRDYEKEYELFLYFFAALVLMCGACSGRDWRIVKWNPTNNGNEKVHLTGDGNIVSTERNVSEFSAIVHTGTGSVRVHFGEDYRVTVSSDSNFQEYIEISVQRDELLIRIADPPYPYSGLEDFKCDIDVYMRDLRRFVLTGAGEVTLDSGSNTDLSVSLTGVGSFDGSQYKVENAGVLMPGVGRIKIWASDTLDVKLSGIGDVYYRGDPSVTKAISGFGSVVKE